MRRTAMTIQTDCTGAMNTDHFLAFLKTLLPSNPFIIAPISGQMGIANILEHLYKLLPVKLEIPD